MKMRRIFTFELQRVFCSKALFGFLCLCLVLTFVFGNIFSHQYQIEQLKGNAEPSPTVDPAFFETYDAMEIYRVLAAARDGSGRPLSALALRLLEQKYFFLDTKIPQLQADSSASDLCFGADTAGIFNDIFNRYSVVLLTLCSAFAALCVFTALGEDRVSRLQELVCAARFGRKTQAAGVLAAVVYTSAVYMILFAVGYFFMFLKNDFTGIWQQSIASLCNSCVTFDAIGPFVPYGSMTVLQYFAASLAVGYLVVLSFLLFAASAACLNRSAFSTVGLFFGVQIGILALLVGKTPGVSSFFFYVLRMTGVGLLYERGLWFSEGGHFTLVPYAETVYALVGIVAASLCFFLAHFFFKKRVNI